MHIRRYLWSIAALAVVLLPHSVLARGHSAFLGIASNPSEVACWSHGGGAMVNNCSGARRWCMPAVVDRAGWFEVVVYASGAGPSNNVGCFAVGINKEISWASQSPTRYLPSFGPTQVIGLGSVYVPDYGTLYVCCDVSTGGRIHNYHYW